MIYHSDDRATHSATATSQNNIATVDIDRLIVALVIFISIGIDEKFTWREEHNTTAIGLCCGNSTYNSRLVRYIIVRDRTIRCNVKNGMRDIGNRFVEIVIARIRKIG